MLIIRTVNAFSCGSGAFLSADAFAVASAEHEGCRFTRNGGGLSTQSKQTTQTSFQVPCCKPFQHQIQQRNLLSYEVSLLQKEVLTFNLRFPMGVLHRFISPYRLKKLFSSNRLGMTFRARCAAASRRMNWPMSCSPRENFPWLSLSESRSEKAMMAADSTHSITLPSKVCLWLAIERVRIRVLLTEVLRHQKYC